MRKANVTRESESMVGMARARWSRVVQGIGVKAARVLLVSVVILIAAVPLFASAAGQAGGEGDVAGAGAQASSQPAASAPESAPASAAEGDAAGEDGGEAAAEVP